MPGNTPDLELIRKRVLAEYQKGKKPKGLAEKYGVSINTIKSWIRRGEVQSSENPQCAPGAEGASKGASRRRRGAPQGNCNAVGNSGGAAPLGNRNARKHGGYSPVYWDTLTDDEKALIENAEQSPKDMLRNEINLLSVRERRIMARIQQIHQLDEMMKSGMGQAVAGVIRTEKKREFDTPEDKALYEEIYRSKLDRGEILPGREITVTTRTEATYDVLQRLEEALTRIEAQKQRCIQTLIGLEQNNSDGTEDEGAKRVLFSGALEELFRDVDNTEK